MNVSNPKASVDNFKYRIDSIKRKIFIQVTWDSVDDIEVCWANKSFTYNVFWTSSTRIGTNGSSVMTVL